VFIFLGVDMKVYLYIDGLQVAKVKRPKNFDFIHSTYRVRAINHKEIFHKFIATITLKPMQIIAVDNNSIDLNCLVYGGTDND
jgi:hypothetical protein